MEADYRRLREEDRRLYAFFELLRAGLWERPVEDTDVFPLSGDDWTFVYDFAVKQTVEGLIWRGIHHLEEDSFPPDGILQKLVARVDYIERMNARTDHVIADLLKIFNRLNVVPVIQKGQDAASMYEHPELRTCGDIDFYFDSKNDFIIANSSVRCRGKKLTPQSDGSYEYTWKRIPIEHHRKLLDIENPFLGPYLKSLERDNLMEKAVDGGLKLRVPSPELNLLMLNAHIMKHAFILGIGLRQLCDMARAYHTLHHRYSGEELENIYSKAGLTKWSSLLHCFLVTYLGLQEYCLPYRDGLALPPEPLLDMVVKGGNFGQYNEKWTIRNRHLLTRKAYIFRTMFSKIDFHRETAPFEAFCKFVHLTTGQANDV
jgi:hypothetical protein